MLCSRVISDSSFERSRSATRAAFASASATSVWARCSASPTICCAFARASATASSAAFCASTSVRWMTSVSAERIGGAAATGATTGAGAATGTGAGAGAGGAPT